MGPLNEFGNARPSRVGPTNRTLPARCQLLERPPAEQPAVHLAVVAHHHGPMLRAFAAVGEAGRGALEADLLDLIARFNRADDGTMVVPSEYLEAVIVRP